MRNYKFRLYPTKQKEVILMNNLNVCKWVYNKFVEQAQKSFVSRNEMSYMLTELKQQEPWLYNYYAKMLQMICTKVESAEKSIMAKAKNGHKTGPLKFVRHNEYYSFTYNQAGYKLEKHGNTTLLKLTKIGFIEIKLHRDINQKIKQVIISRSKSGKWYALITCELDYSVQPKISFEKSVGIDLGIKSFAYDSDNHSTPNPLNLKKMLKPLARANRKVSRRIKGSNNRLKAIKRLQKIHEKIANRRKDFQHKLSTIYAKHYDIIFVEDLKLANLAQNNKLAQSISDSSWGTFIEKLEYKCKLLVKIQPRNTTIDCSRCGNKVPKSLAVRIHRCDKCNLVIDRDYNASINILQKGLRIFNPNKLPQELRKVTPVEISQKSMKQEQTNVFNCW